MVALDVIDTGELPRFVPLRRLVIKGSQLQLKHQADLSSTAYVYSVDPYGTATLTSTSGGSGVPENPYLYGGGLQDRATGHLKFGARWYDPTAGTWTQQDDRNTPLDPHNANRYAYAGGDPINNSDPTGQGFWDVVAKVAFNVLLEGTIATECSAAIIGFGGPEDPIGDALCLAGASATTAAFAEWAE